MSKLTLPALTLLSLTLCACGYLAQPEAPAPEPPVVLDPDSVKVTVDWTAGTPVSPLSYGLNGFKAFDPKNAASAAYNENLRYMNPGVLRYHAVEMMGDSKTTDRGWIDTAGQRWDAEKINAALSGLSANDPIKLMNIPSWPSWMDADKDDLLDSDKVDAYAQFCADLVRIVNVEGHHQVNFWEPTNERDDVYYVKPRGAGQPDQLDQLISIYNKAALAMKAVDPTIQVGGLAFARADLYPQVERFMAGTLAAGTLDFLSFHGYASGDPKDSDEAIYNRIYNPTDRSVNSLTKHTADIRAMLDKASPKRHIPLWMDEYNISWAWWTGEKRMHTNKGGVFDALAMVYLTGAGADATMAWNEKDGAYGKTDDDDVLRPGAHVFHFMNRYMIGERAKTQSGDETAIAASAVESGRGEHALLIVNRSDKRQQITLQMQGWQPDTASLNRYEVSNLGLTRSAVTWSDVKAGALRVPPYSVTWIVAGDQGE